MTTHRPLATLVLGLGLLLLSSGCADDAGKKQDDPEDTLRDPDVVMLDVTEDLAPGDVPDGDTTPDPDAPDTDVPGPSTPRQAVVPTSGGGTMRSPRHVLRLGVGGPPAATSLSGANHRLTLGPGAARP